MSLASQGVKNSSILMVVKVGRPSPPLPSPGPPLPLPSGQVGTSAAMEVVAEQRRMLQETKVGAARLGERDANKEDYFMQASPSVFVDPQIQFAVNLVSPN